METRVGSGPDNRGLGDDSDRWRGISISILSALLILDILTTQIILSGGGVEYNPFMAGIVRNPIAHILVKMLLLILVVLVAKCSEIQLKGSSVMLFTFIIGWYLICLGNNLGSILKLGIFT